jgi:hypothetical protein
MPRTSSSYIAFTLNKRTLSLINFVIKLPDLLGHLTPATVKGQASLRADMSTLIQQAFSMHAHLFTLRPTS